MVKQNYENKIKGVIQNHYIILIHCWLTRLDFPVKLFCLKIMKTYFTAGTKCVIKRPPKNLTNTKTEEFNIFKNCK